MNEPTPEQSKSAQFTSAQPTLEALRLELAELTQAAEHEFNSAISSPQLQQVKTKHLGKSSRLAAIRGGIGSLDKQMRREVGQLCNAASHTIEVALENRLAELLKLERSAQLEAESVDLTEVLGEISVGHFHIITQTRRALEDVFCGMGYQVAEGPEIETEWHNFGALNFPQGHPARDMYDTLYVDWGKPMSTLLRTHTSPVQVRTMTSQPPPIAVVAPGRCFRRDTADATHMPVFHQIEGLLIDHDISLGHLAGTIEAFTSAFFGEGFTSRLRPSYFPFTEPSAEFDIQRPDGSWLELGGSGMVHPNVLEACGIDPQEWSGFAFGFGIDRLAMIRYGVDDLRYLWTGDMRFLKQF